ncbi:MAG: hypothetical protein F4X89_12060 [Dehalococcoidia bacterium]|nr:hypothetical protein [Dehalococcoidia bacterium]
MLTLTRFDHISMAAHDWREQRERFERLFGFRYLRRFTPHPGTPFEGCVTRIRNTKIEWELLQPDGPESFVQRFLDQRGPGLHHLTVQVPDIEEAVAELERLGITPFGGISEDTMWWMAYIHPRDSGGVLWQLYQAKSDQAVNGTTGVAGVVGFRRLDHVSLASPDLEAQAAWQERVFGMEVERRWDVSDQGYKGCLMRIPNTELTLEILEPLGEEGFLQDFLANRGKGLHHVSCEVESLDRALDALAAEGIEPPGGVGGEHWKRNVFLSPRDTNGVLFQLFEEPSA